MFAALRFSGIVSVVLFSVGGHCAEPAAPSTAAKKDPERTYRGLFVAVTDYDHPKVRDLQGPGNDVVLFKKTLAERFEVPVDRPGMFAELSEAAAKKNGSAFRPTRQNIEREFKALIKATRPGDQVIVLIGGHGSRQPAKPAKDVRYRKADGKDQILLPADIGTWDGESKSVERAIVDSELRDWCKAITAKDASLWVTLDTCHSGMILRGQVEDEVERSVDPGDLGIPEAEEATRGGDAPSSTFALADQSPNFVGIYACEPAQVEIEAKLGSEGKRYGLLTYTMCEILNRAPRSITYEELASGVQLAYRSVPRYIPNPLIEGVAQSRSVLGLEHMERPPFKIIENQEGQIRINGGELLGITKGSILAVIPPTAENKGDAILGHVEVTAARFADSTVKPYEHDGIKAPDAKELVVESRCRPVSVSFGSFQLPVAVDEKPIDPKVPAEKLALLKGAKTALESISKAPGTLVQLASKARPASWLVQYRGGGLKLVPAASAEYVDLPVDVPCFPVEEDAEKIESDLSEKLFTIARANNLTRLAANIDCFTQAADNSDGPGELSRRIDVQVSPMRLADVDDEVGKPFSLVDGRLQMRPGDLVAWRIVNNSVGPVDVTLLAIDANFGVTALFPSRPDGFEHRMKPRDQLTVGHARVNDATFGDEQLVLIAMPATRESPTDFTVLVQPAVRTGLPTNRGEDLNSPLFGLLANAMLEDKSMRGYDSLAPKSDPCSVKSMPYKIVRPVAQK